MTSECSNPINPVSLLFPFHNHAKLRNFHSKMEKISDFKHAYLGGMEVPKEKEGPIPPGADGMQALVVSRS